MKKILVVCVLFCERLFGTIIILLLSSTITAQQWIQQNSLPTSDYFTALTMAGTQTIIVGGGSTLLRSTDNGQSWQSFLAPRRSIISDIHFPTSEVGYAVCNINQLGLPYGGTSILKSIDNGVSWSAIYEDQFCIGPFEAIWFTDVNNGFLVGDFVNNAKIAHTNDGGLTWTPIEININKGLKDVIFFNSMEGVIIGESGTILYTNDGGNSWQQKDSKTTQDLQSIHFVYPNTCVAVGKDGAIVRSIDRGLSWTLYSPPSSVISDLQSVFMITEQIGFIGSPVKNYISNTCLLRTTNGGVSWDTLQSPGLESASRIFFLNTQTGYAAGTKGSFAITIDGGLTWTILDNAFTRSDLKRPY
ncbi:MAG: YCF48-related protein, partial [Bacteroidota bacterium]